MAPLLRTENLTRSLTGEVAVTLVKDASIEVSIGEFVAITGPSGSGKSSLLYLLGLLDSPTSGRIIFDGLDLSTQDEDELAALRLEKMGFVFQFHFLLPEFTALENVMMPMRRLGKWKGAAGKEKALQLLADVGVADQAHKLPRQLSGGSASELRLPELWQMTRFLFWPMNRQETWIAFPVKWCRISCAIWRITRTARSWR